MTRQEMTQKMTFEQAAQIYEDVVKEIETRAYRAARLFNQMLEDSGVQYDQDHDRLNADVIDEVEQGGVVFRWSSHWAYGGHDEGTCYVAAKMLEDDTWEDATRELATKFIKGKTKTKRAAARALKKQEKAELARLKKKYEGEAR